MNSENSDAINNLINSIQEKMNNNESSQTSNDNNTSFDLSSILNTIGNKSENNNKENEKENSGFDPNILLKLQSILSNMNANNPRKNLLLSLKPFLRKSRQDKMSEYITILNVLSILDSLRNKGSD